MNRPQTRYAKVDGVHIAYQVMGNGSPDMVLIPNWVSHLEAMWDIPAFARFLERIASFGRLIMLDPRGTGVSDPVDQLPTLELWADDVATVLDDVGVPRAALIGASAGGAVALMFAATHPDRTSSLVLVNAVARIPQDVDYPFGMPLEAKEEYLAAMLQGWGSPVAAGMAAPSSTATERERMARMQREMASPAKARALFGMMFDTDVRDILPTIRVPTLVVHRANVAMVPVDLGRYVADCIPGAKFVEVPGGDWIVAFGDTDSIVGEVQEFLTGVRSPPEHERVLATVLFTDLVGSTEKAAALGDAGWRELLAQHDDAVREELERFRGQEIKTVGDGFVATFDGPARGVRCARAIVEAVGALGLEARAGLHTGEIELVGGDIRGIAVHIGARVSATSGPQEVLVTSTVKDLVAGSGIEFEDRGAHQLKGVPGEWRLFAVAAP